jgi:hypothetical protein
MNERSYLSKARRANIVFLHYVSDQYGGQQGWRACSTEFEREFQINFFHTHARYRIQPFLSCWDSSYSLHSLDIVYGRSCDNLTYKYKLAIKTQSKQTFSHIYLDIGGPVSLVHKVQNRSDCRKSATYSYAQQNSVAHLKWIVDRWPAMELSGLKVNQYKFVLKW